MNQFLGRSGEKRFSTLCSDARVTCNEPREDDNGWDHIVEFPHRGVPGVPADEQRGTPPMFVQTKSHEREGLGVKMRLSNALRLARSPNPCFVAVARISEDRSEADWYAAHFWGDFIGRTLKRARQANYDGIPESAFNDHTITFTLSAGDAHDDAALLPWMEATVVAVGPDYAKIKQGLHPEASIVGTMEFGPLNSIGELVDHALGLTPTIAMKSVTMNMRRFDIDIPFPLPSGPPITASIKVEPVCSCDVLLRGPHGADIQLAGDVFVPPFPNLPAEVLKYRIRTSLMDIVWSPDGQSTLTGRYTDESEHTPSQLLQVLRSGSWAGSGPIDLTASVDDEPIFEATAHLDPNEDQETFKILAELASPLADVSRHLTKNLPLISIRNVMACDALEPFYRLMTGPTARLTAVLPDGIDAPEYETAVAAGLIKVGDWTFGAIQRRTVETMVIDDHRNVRIELGPPTLLLGAAFAQSDTGGMERFRGDYERRVNAPKTLALGDALISLVNADGMKPSDP